MNEEQQPEKKDRFWISLVLAFTFLAAFGTTYMAVVSQPILAPLYYVGTLIMLLEYIHYRYIDVIEKLLKEGRT